MAIAGDGHFGTLERRLALLNIADDSIAFDTYCPSIAQKVGERTCPRCKHYHSSKKSVKDHSRAKICQNAGVAANVEITLGDSSDEEPMESTNDTAEKLPIVDSNDEYLARFLDVKEDEINE